MGFKQTAQWIINIFSKLKPISMNFADLKNSDDSTIFTNLQFNKYENLICKLAYS